MTTQTKQNTMGPTQKIMGKECYFITSVEDEDSIKYDLFCMFDGTGAIRSIDIDSGHVITICHFPSYNKAKEKFKEYKSKSLLDQTGIGSYNSGEFYK